MRNHILVTGGLGFIGLHTVERLLKLGYTVRILDFKLPEKLLPENCSISAEKNQLNIKITNEVTKSAELIIGDIRDVQSCKKSCENISTIIHIAGMASIGESIKKPSKAASINLTGTRNILSQAVKSNIKRFIYLSSAKIYGDVEKPSHEDDVPNPQTPYARTKIAAENFCLSFSDKNKIENFILRPFSVYGPNQNLNYGYIGSILKAFLFNYAPVLPGDEKIARDYTFIDDVINAIEKLLFYDKLQPKVFNIGSGKSYTTKTLIDIFNNITGNNVQPIYTELLHGMESKTFADMTRTRNELNLQISTMLENGLEKTIKWFLSKSDKQYCKIEVNE